MSAVRGFLMLVTLGLGLLLDAAVAGWKRVRRW